MLQTYRTLKIGILLAVIVTLGIIGIHSTTSSTQAAPDSLSKVLYVRGEQSFIMNGDSLNVDPAAGGDHALPYFLSHGWKVRSLHVANNSEKDVAVGYVVLER